VRIGVLGAGLIAQVEHIPNIRGLTDKFDLVGVSDPSATARAFVAQHFGVPVHRNLSQLLDARLDAVVIATPDPFHAETTLAALEAGVHVFCEKPLCYSVGDADAILRARETSGCVVQVGYMKRFDPSYEAALELLPEGGRGLRYVAVEVNDPDSWPFVAHHPHRRGDDVPKALKEEGRKKQDRQVKEALGWPITGAARQGFTGAYFSSLVHDVNAVYGMLDRMGIDDDHALDGQFFAGGDGGSGTVSLLGGTAIWQMMHLTVPSLAHYRERISLYFDGALIELVFPSPYLNHQPTELRVQSSRNLTLETRQIRNGFEGAYVRELEGFWASIVDGAPTRNTVEHAKRDQQLLATLARLALNHQGAE
jgi:predicted dehydrogenase